MGFGRYSLNPPPPDGFSTDFWAWAGAGAYEGWEPDLSSGPIREYAGDVLVRSLERSASGGFVIPERQTAAALPSGSGAAVVTTQHTSAGNSNLLWWALIVVAGIMLVKP